MAIHLTTLGGLIVRREGVELERLLRQRSRLALLVYLSVERQVSRDLLTTVFWPESSSDNARHALRQSLYHLRSELGEDWLEQHPHDLRVGAGMRTDVQDLSEALERQDAETAARLYGGPFLDGVHLVDLQAWESWVDERRAHCTRMFRAACRAWLESRLAEGDLSAAIGAARHWVARDPLDDEGQHRLVETLAHAGERTEAIRQFEAYARLLDAEGLRPLDQTQGLIDRIRSDSAFPSTLRPVTEIGAEEGVSPAPPVREPAGGRQTGVPEGPAAGPPSPGPAAGVAARSVRRRRWLGVTASLGLALVVAAAWILMRGAREPQPIASDRIAVLPFAVRGSDEARYLGEGMVTLLTTALDGATLRPIDARAVLATVAPNGGAVADPERGRRHATRLGAGLFVLGDVVQAGGALQVQAAVYRTAGPVEPAVRVMVDAEPERVFDLVDELAARLLAGLGPASNVRLTRTAAMTTGSLPAFKAYLDGESDIRASRFERAADSYLRAIAHDSAFAVAHYRLALARDWASQSGYREAARAAARHADRLSPHDRALLEALQAYHEGDGPEAERRYRAILARYPDDLEAWLQLAETQFHYGPLRGRPTSDSEPTWRSVLAYEPTNRWALVHLGRIAAAQGRPATIDSLLARFDAHRLGTDRRLVQLGLLRAVTARDSARAVALVRTVRGWEDAAAYQLGAYLTAFAYDPEAARWVVRELIEPRRGPGMIADLHWFTALLHMAGGELSAAQDALMEAHAVSEGVSSGWYRRTFRLATEWFAYTAPLPWPDSTLERVRRDALAARVPRQAAVVDSTDGVGEPLWFALARDVLGRPGRMEALRLYAVGALSLRLDDAAGAATASASLRRLERSREADWFIRDLHRELRALTALHAGRAGDGLRILERRETGPVSLGAVNIVPFAARAHGRYLRGELLRALGRDAEALPWFASLGAFSVLEIAYRAPAHLRQARIHERVGNVDEAARHYRRFSELWSRGDEPVRALVRRTRTGGCCPRSTRDTGGAVDRPPGTGDR